MRLSVGNECGRINLKHVEIYNLFSGKETTIHFVTGTKSEVRSSQVQGPLCGAVFNLDKSGVLTLKFISQGSKLIVGHESSRCHQSEYSQCEIDEVREDWATIVINEIDM